MFNLSDAMISHALFFLTLWEIMINMRESSHYALHKEQDLEMRTQKSDKIFMAKLLKSIQINYSLQHDNGGASCN